MSWASHTCTVRPHAHLAPHPNYRDRMHCMPLLVLLLVTSRKLQQVQMSWADTLVSILVYLSSCHQSIPPSTDAHLAFTISRQVIFCLPGTALYYCIKWSHTHLYSPFTELHECESVVRVRSIVHKCILKSVDCVRGDISLFQAYRTCVRATGVRY